MTTQPSTTDRGDDTADELQLIEAVLRGYPESMARADALRAVKKLLAASRPSAQGGERADYASVTDWLDKNCKRVGWNIESATFEITDEAAHRLITEFATPPATSGMKEGMVGDTERAELEKLRFYKRVGFPYTDHSTMFHKDHCGYIAITVPAHLPHPESEGTVAGKVIRGYTVAQVYEKAKAHMAEIEGAAIRADRKE